LVGLRERLTGLGGELTSAATEQGHYRLVARLPFPEQLPRAADPVRSSP
jgi:hypothetical protein